ncbi:MAG: hypothetical protein Q4Q03_00825 [Bowdeniella nasicola]|nr:hypothetical protein [Bowdeniella nasicola]
MQHKTIKLAGVNVRTPAAVMAESDLGYAYPNRHSFVRTMLRRAWRQKWQVERERFEMDDLGRGHCVYKINAEGVIMRWVAFSTILDESERTDRVIAKRWDITTALVEGDIDDARLAYLQEQVPLQEKGIADAGTLIWARANRSARFFNAVVEGLAAGKQPDPTMFGPSPYLVRSTAFYSNGRFNLLSFEAIDTTHPLRVPYRPHMLSAWLLRELSLDLVEHVAKRKNPNAARLSPAWRRYFGVGNATGLGLVPYAMSHPLIMESWARVREISLGAVLDRPIECQAEIDAQGHVAAPTPGAAVTGSTTEAQTIEKLLAAAITFVQQRDAKPDDPFLDDVQLVAQLQSVQRRLDELLAACERGQVHTWRELYAAAQAESGECGGLVASILVELSSDLDLEMDELLTVDETLPLDPTMPLGEVIERINQTYDWLEECHFDEHEHTRIAWHKSATNEEPRRVDRDEVNRPETELPIYAGWRVAQLRDVLRKAEAGGRAQQPVGEFLLNAPQWRQWVARVQAMSETFYGEMRINVTDPEFLPLTVQRFQLAMYGMINFMPQDTNWLRVTLLSGTPSVTDLGADTESDWLFVKPPKGEV